jgi:hypothetical protein
VREIQKKCLLYPLTPLLKPLGITGWAESSFLTISFRLQTQEMLWQAGE